MHRLSKHRLLLVNDDGIDAPGIILLEKIARRYTDEVWVVAPDEEKSGASHSISMNMPVRVRKRDDRHFAITGTPTDCVLLAIYEIMSEKPTMLLSGINRGANLGEDITYSGTAAAAMEGALIGIPSVALSQVFTPRATVPQQLCQREFSRCASERSDRNARDQTGPATTGIIPARTEDRCSGCTVLLDQTRLSGGRIRSGNRPRGDPR